MYSTASREKGSVNAWVKKNGLPTRWSGTYACQPSFPMVCWRAVAGGEGVGVCGCGIGGDILWDLVSHLGLVHDQYRRQSRQLYPEPPNYIRAIGVWSWNPGPPLLFGSGFIGGCCHRALFVDLGVNRQTRLFVQCVPCHVMPSYHRYSSASRYVSLSGHTTEYLSKPFAEIPRMYSI